MGQDMIKNRADDLHELRLFALGRIPRCARCPRYHALVAADAGLPMFSPVLPTAPVFCSHQVCAPLVDRHNGSLESGDQPSRAACGL